jgi:hypothetical protein
MTLATTSSATRPSTSQRGQNREKFSVSPLPVMRPMRALANWMPTISG